MHSMTIVRAYFANQFLLKLCHFNFHSISISIFHFLSSFECTLNPCMSYALRDILSRNQVLLHTVVRGDYARIDWAEAAIDYAGNGAQQRRSQLPDVTTIITPTVQRNYGLPLLFSASRQNNAAHLLLSAVVDYFGSSWHGCASLPLLCKSAPHAVLRSAR